MQKIGIKHLDFMNRIITTKNYKNKLFDSIKALIDKTALVPTIS